MSKKIVIKLDTKKMTIAGLMFCVCIIVTYTYLIALYAFDAPSNDLPLDIIGLDTLDNGNVSQVTFSKGDLVRINVTVEKALSYYWNLPLTYDTYAFIGDTSYKLIILVMDKNKMPVFFESVDEVISTAGTKVSFVDYSVSSSAVTGAYNVTAFLWSDWLPDGIALSPSVGEVSFSVS